MVIYTHRGDNPINYLEANEMKKFTVVIWNGETPEKIERHESKLNAVMSAWEAKMVGKRVKVVNDDCETIYQ